MADLKEEEAFIDPSEIIERIVLSGDADPEADGDEAETPLEPTDEAPVVVDQSLQRFAGHTDSVYCVAVSADGKTALSGGGDDVAYLWDVASGKQLFKLEGHTDSVSVVDFNFDSTRCATGSMDGTVRIYKVLDGTFLHSLEGPGQDIEWIQWHSKGNVLAAGSLDSTVWMWDANTAACMQVFAGHTGSVMSGQWTFDGRQLVTAAEDGGLMMWSPKTGKRLKHLRAKKGFSFHEAPVACLATHHSEKLVLTGGLDGSCFLTNLKTGKVVGKLEGHTGAIESVGFCKQMKWAASASMDRTVKIWDMDRLQPRHTLEHPDVVMLVRWHPDKPIVYTACLDHVVRMYDARKGTLLESWTGHTDAIMYLALAGDAVVTASDDRRCLVFAPTTKR